MAGNPKTIYIREQDRELWERLASLAVQRRTSVSAILAELIENYIGRVNAQA